MRRRLWTNGKTWWCAEDTDELRMYINRLQPHQDIEEHELKAFHEPHPPTPIWFWPSPIEAAIAPTHAILPDSWAAMLLPGLVAIQFANEKHARLVIGRLRE